MSELPPTQTEARRRLDDAAPALLSAALALVLYAVTLGGTFVYDDQFIVHDDDRLHDASRWVEYWTSDYFGGALDRLWRPLVSMSFAVQWRLHGERPWAFHAVNWVLHAGVCALVAELARRLCGRRAAYAAGLLFAAHPVHVEAVAAIVGRSELMCAAGTVGALVLLARRPLTGGRIFGVWACLVVALLSKEQGMLLPLLMLLQWVALQWKWGPGPVRDVDGEGRRQPGKWLVFLAVATLAGYVVYREQTIRFWWDRAQLDWVMNPLVRSRGADRWLVPLALLGRYAGLLVAPWRLSLDYGGAVIGWQARAADAHLWLGAAALLAWAALLALAVRRRWWIAAFCVLAVGVTYGMVANALTLIGTIFNERLLYLPSVFFLVLLGIGAARAWGRWPRATTGTLALLVLLGSLRTFTYARLWNDRLALYEAAVREQPRSVQLHLLLSSEYRDRGDGVASARVMEAARRLAPDYWLVYNYSALAELARGDLDAAEAYAARSMGMHPDLEAAGIQQRIDKARAATRPATTPAITQPAR